MSDPTEDEALAQQRDWEAHEAERKVLFSNEAFLIGVHQAVSGGSLFATLAQFESLAEYAGVVPVLVFMSLMTAALASAVLAAHWKHDYKMWDVKGRVSKAKKDIVRAVERSTDASEGVGRMRCAMDVSTALIVAALTVLILSLWAGQL
jgi:hypothetical protein